MPVNRFTEGASAERKAIRRILAKLQGKESIDTSTLLAVEVEIKRRVRLSQKRKGGIGRK